MKYGFEIFGELLVLHISTTYEAPTTSVSMKGASKKIKLGKVGPSLTNGQKLEIHFKGIEDT